MMKSTICYMFLMLLLASSCGQRSNRSKAVPQDMKDVSVEDSISNDILSANAIDSVRKTSLENVKWVNCIDIPSYDRVDVLKNEEKDTLYHFSNTSYNAVKTSRNYTSQYGATSTFKITTLNKFQVINNRLIDLMADFRKLFRVPKDAVIPFGPNINYSTTDVCDYYGKMYGNAVDKYKEEEPLDSLDEELSSRSLYNYCLGVEILPVFVSSNIVSYSFYQYDYNGGAHGNYEYFIASFDRNTNRHLEKLDDFIRNEDRDTVLYMLAEQLAVGYEYSSVEDYIDYLNKYNYTNYQLSDSVNFPIYYLGLNSQGLVAYYPRYSIEAGVAGCPRAVLPYAVINDYLLPQFRIHEEKP